jgi:hypothetical protein
MPLFTNTQKLEIIHASVQRAMKEFNRRIDSSAVLTEGEQYSIKKARLKESARISTDKGLQEYLLALSSGLEMLKEFERYEKVKTGEARLTANNEQTEEIVQKRFLHAHQEVLSEHGSLVKEMLMKNSIVSDTKEMDSTTHRMNHLKAYVAKPDSVLRYNLVAKDAEEVEKTIRYARYKVIAGAMMKLLSWGLIALGLVIGVSSAVSTLVIGPAGFAGFALTKMKMKIKSRYPNQMSHPNQNQQLMYTKMKNLKKKRKLQSYCPDLVKSLLTFDPLCFFPINNSGINTNVF